MATISSSERLLKTICGSCLILAPALLLVGGLIHPEETTDAARQFEIIVDNLGRWELAHWFISAAMLLMMGAVVGLAHLLHEHRPAEGIVGGAATAVGVMALFAVATFEAVTVPRIGQSGDAQLFEDIFTSSDFRLLLGLVLLVATRPDHHELRDLSEPCRADVGRRLCRLWARCSSPSRCRPVRR